MRSKSGVHAGRDVLQAARVGRNRDHAIAGPAGQTGDRRQNAAVGPAILHVARDDRVAIARHPVRDAAGVPQSQGAAEESEIRPPASQDAA